MGGGGFIPSSGGGNVQPEYAQQKLTWAVLVAGGMAACSGLLFGYDIGISGGVSSMDPFLQRFFPGVYRNMQSQAASSNSNYCKFNSQILTLFTSSLYIAGLVGSFAASFTTRAIGRKVSLLIGGGVFLAGAIINALAMNVGMLIGGRLLLGLGIGFGVQSAPLYLSEVSPPKHRGKLNICFQLLITVAIFAANVVNYFTDKMSGGQGWRWSLGLAMVPAAFMTIGACFLPDTPNSLIERGREDEALANLIKIRGTQHVDAEFRDMVKASEAAKKVKKPWRALLDRRNRPHLCMAIFLPMLQQLTGINVVMFYQPVLFKTLGLGSNASLLSSAVSGLVNVLATFVSIAVVDRFGRRVLFLEGGVQMFLSQLLVGFLLLFGFGASGTGVLSPTLAWAVLVAICVYVSGFAWSWGPLAWLVPSETFPLEVRSVGLSIVGSVNLFMTFVIAQAFLPMLCAAKYGLFFVFAGMVLVMTAYAGLLVPETRKVPIEEMQRVYREHWYWKKYVVEEAQTIPSSSSSSPAKGNSSRLDLNC